MDRHLAFVGFGEAGAAFGTGLAACGYDRQTDEPRARDAKLADFAAAGVLPCDSLAAAIDGATAILSLVTADQALAVAEATAPLIGEGTLFFDMNSVAPDTKRAAARAIEAAGGATSMSR